MSAGRNISGAFGVLVFATVSEKNMLKIRVSPALLALPYSLFFCRKRREMVFFVLLLQTARNRDSCAALANGEISIFLCLSRIGRDRSFPVIVSLSDEIRVC